MPETVGSQSSTFIFESICPEFMSISVNHFPSQSSITGLFYQWLHNIWFYASNFSCWYLNLPTLRSGTSCRNFWAASLKEFFFFFFLGGDEMLLFKWTARAEESSWLFSATNYGFGLRIVLYGKLGDSQALKKPDCKFLVEHLPFPQTNCNTFIHPLELAATTMSDFPLQQTLETNCILSSSDSFPEIGSMEPNLWEVIGIGRDLW